MTTEKNPNQKSLIEAATKSDLTIKVQNGIFLVHKDILLTQNKVLKTLTSALSSESEISSSINIPGIDSSIFKLFLMFIYTRKVEKENISNELLFIAHKYADAKLMKICEDHLLSELCEEKAIELLELGTKIESKKLKDESSKFIVDRFEAMKKQVAFKNIRENPLAVDAIFSQFEVNMDRLYNDMDVLKSIKNSIADDKLSKMISIPFIVLCLFLFCFRY